MNIAEMIISAQSKSKIELPDTSNKREKLVFAAISAFTKNGYESTSIENILDETKHNYQRISRRTFYKYFKSKRDVLEAVRDIFSGSGIKKYYEEKIKQLEDKSSQIKLFLFIEQIFTQMTPEYLNVMKMNFRLLIDPELQQLLETDISDFSDSILNIIIDLLKDIGLKNPEINARLLHTLLRGILFEIIIHDSNGSAYDQELLLKMKERLFTYISKIVQNK